MEKGKRFISLILIMFVCLFLFACKKTNTISSTDIVAKSSSTTISSTTEIIESTTTNTISSTTENITENTVSTSISTKENSSLTTTEDINFSDSRIYIPEEINNFPRYSQLSMSANGLNVPLYTVLVNFSHTFNGEAPNRMENAVATVCIDGPVLFELESTFKINNYCVVRPLSKNVKPEFDDEDLSKVSFVISEPGQYTVEFRSDRTLHLFVEMIPEDGEYDDSSNMYFAPGIHNKNNDSRIGSDNKVRLSSNTHVYLAPGSVIEGAFIADNASNIEISGLGYISGAKFDRSVQRGTVTVPIEFNNCNNITLRDFSCLDPAGWTFNMYFDSDITIDNVKIISSRANGDGISLQSCKHVQVTNSFVRTWDDSLVVKNYPLWSNRSVEGTTFDISFDNILIWTDLAQSMEIGYETVGEIMQDISFTNITVLHNFHKAVISIHNGNNANVMNVLYDNIVVEDAQMGKGDGSPYLIDFSTAHSSTWSDQHKITSLGSISNITVKNVKVLSGVPNLEIHIRGAIEERSSYPNVVHYIDDVSISDLCIYGNYIDETYERYVSNYANNVSFIITNK